ncbi:MAG: winged helix-turn-helix domain-containing protein [Paracoccaceae bacterium]
MVIPVLQNEHARRVFLDRHALLEQPAGAAGGASLLELIQRLGFVQLDSINTVARAHDLILHARRPAYRPKNLRRLHDRDRGLFEHWTHDAAVIPMEFYPHWHLRFIRDAALLKSRWRNWRRDGFEQRFETVLQHIRDHGPVSSSDVGTDEKKGSGGWWDWHPSKTALEYLWRSGALTVTRREGFRKIYDLTKRVIEDTLCPGAIPCDEDTTIDWLCSAALDRLGFATSGEIAAFWDTVKSSEAKQWCQEQLDSGASELIDVMCSDGKLRRTFARPGLIDTVAGLGSAPGRLRVLSPFDPALRDRQRAERLFGFQYRIEVFVPAPKRKYGYYVFPLLEGDRLVGRIDMKAFRDEDCLRISALWPERGVRWGKARQARLEAEIERIRRLADVTHIQYQDGWLRTPL